MLILVVFLCVLQLFENSNSTVLDPALYLAPSPPLTLTKGNNQEISWRQLQVPVETITSETPVKNENLDTAETFWPRLYSNYGLKSIHIPLQFHITGTYGGHAGTGVISSGYASMSSKNVKTLAGTNYGYSGLRIYGGNDAPAWGGWGNGKWGHYGKG